MPNKRKRKHKSLIQAYFDDATLPLCFFIFVSIVMFFIGGQWADPVLQSNEVIVLMLWPSLFAVGIPIAAIAHLGKNKTKAAVANLFAFLLSLICLPVVFFGLCLIGMSY